MVLRQFIPAEPLFGSQSSSTLLSGSQDILALSSPYLGLKVVYFY